MRIAMRIHGGGTAVLMLTIQGIRTPGRANTRFAPTARKKRVNDGRLNVPNSPHAVAPLLNSPLLTVGANFMFAHENRHLLIVTLK